MFHFVFGLRQQTEPFHLMHYLCLASCIAVNRPDAVMFHCKNEPWGDYWDRIKPALRLVPLEPDAFVGSYRYSDPALDKFRYAHLADIARLDILSEHGGIYADMDTLFVAPVPAALFEHSFVMGREHAHWTPAVEAAGGSLCNAWMMGEPGAPFAREWLRRTPGAFDGTWNAHSCLLPFRLSREHPEWIHVEPERSFFHFDFGTGGVRDIFKRRVRDLDRVYSMHLWSHLWWDATTRSRAFFHSGRLTPAYVRHANTTYAAIARKHLPTDVGNQGSGAWLTERLKATVENALWLGHRVKDKVRRMISR